MDAALRRCWLASATGLCRASRAPIVLVTARHGEEATLALIVATAQQEPCHLGAGARERPRGSSAPPRCNVYVMVCGVDATPAGSTLPAPARTPSAGGARGFPGFRLPTRFPRWFWAPPRCCWSP